MNTFSPCDLSSEMLMQCMELRANTGIIMGPCFLCAACMYLLYIKFVWFNKIVYRKFEK
jgi:hypothetical protein